MLSHPLLSFSANAEYETPAWFVQGHVPCKGRRSWASWVPHLFLYFPLSLSLCPLLAKQPEAYILLTFSQWHPVPSQREEAHLSQEEIQLPSRKDIKEQRTADLFWAANMAKKPHQNGSLDPRNLRTLKICKYESHLPVGRKLELSPINRNMSSWGLCPKFPQPRLLWLPSLNTFFLV